MKKNFGIIILALCMMMAGCGKANTPSATKDTGIYCTLYVECSEAIKHQEQLAKGLIEYLPEDGIILEETKLKIEKGDSVYDILERTMRQNGILMETSFTGDIAYIEGIDNLYEFDCGDLSGWTYSVNGEYPQVGCSSYDVKEGDRIEWHYTCNLGQVYEGE